MKAGGLPHLNSYELCFPKFSQKTSCLKSFPKVSPKKIPKNSRSFKPNISAKVSQILAPISTPKKPSCFEISLTNLTEAAMAVKESAGSAPMVPWEENSEWVDLCNQKTEAVEKMGGCFFFKKFLNFCIARRSFFFENWDPGFIIQRLTLTCI